ncbi:MAG: BRCT domain-containing protein [Pseudooceanicola sp.]|nr:BRCT domain-containing protein [Pseudooceanicola sp.]
MLRIYNQARLDDRQVTELIGIARGLIVDGHLSDTEIHFLRGWLAANEGVTGNPLIGLLVDRIETVMADGVIDEDERRELHETLTEMTANDFEVGEALKATTLPLCRPAPDIAHPGKRFCFTGTFTFGKRNECEAAASERGGAVGSLTQKTDFLVIGEYATDSWAQSSFGRKIEKAVAMREAGVPIHIVSEAHWRKFL